MRKKTWKFFPQFLKLEKVEIGGIRGKALTSNINKVYEEFRVSSLFNCLSSSWESMLNSCNPRIYTGCSVCERMTAWTQMTMGFSRIMKASTVKSHLWTGSHWCLSYIFIRLHLCLEHSPTFSRKLGAILGRAFEDCIVSESLFKLLYIFGNILVDQTMHWYVD